MDAFLLVSYGSPERREDVVPFLENLFAGSSSTPSSMPSSMKRPVTPERIAAAAEKYYRFADRTGRYGPLNDECRALLQHLAGTPALSTDGAGVPAKFYWGNLFWRPRLEDTLAEMTADGVTRTLCFITSAFGSHASRQRYVDAVEAVRPRGGPEIVWLPLPHDRRLFLEAQADRLLEALAWAVLDEFAEPSESENYVIFTAHSIPKSDAGASEYVEQLTESARKIVELVGPLPWELAWQSRSAGRPEDWLGPDVKDRIRTIAAEGRCRSVVVSPLGFFCENMETVNDLDWELGELCAELGLGFRRARAVGGSPKILRMIREMIEEKRSRGET